MFRLVRFISKSLQSGPNKSPILTFLGPKRRQLDLEDGSYMARRKNTTRSDYCEKPVTYGQSMAVSIHGFCSNSWDSNCNLSGLFQFSVRSSTDYSAL